MDDWFYKKADNWVEVTRAELDGLVRDGELSQDSIVGWKGLTGSGFAYRDIDAEFFHVYRGETLAAHTEEALHQAAQLGQVHADSLIYGRRLPEDGVRYRDLHVSDISFIPSVREFVKQRGSKATTVLSGPNNAGKSLLLKLLRREIGPHCCLLSCNRFYHFDSIGSTPAQPGMLYQQHSNWIASLYRDRNNNETNDYSVQQTVGMMKDDERKRLWSLCSELLGEPFAIKRQDPENELSGFYVAVGERNLRLSSTGTRMVLMIAAALLDTRYRVFLLDEPEMGLSPKLQALLAGLLYSKESREKYFPHIASVVIATHSHIFLDRADIGNNFCVSRMGSAVGLEQLATFSDFHRLQFEMLGNDLENLWLPSAIVIVEGPTDRDYLERLFRLRLKDRSVAVVTSEGEGDAPKKLRTIDEIVGGLQKSPYLHRTFVVLDQRHSAKLGSFTRQGIPEGNVKILARNGIEYYYPSILVSREFGLGDCHDGDGLSVKNNDVSANGITFTKTELCRRVVDQLDSTTEIPEELCEKVIRPVEEAVLGRRGSPSA